MVNRIDIMQARNQIETLVTGLASGTGVSFADKSIILYVNGYNAEQEIRNRIGSNYQGFPLKFVYTSQPIAFQ